MDILIFATNIEKAEEVNSIKPLLTSIGAINKWNIDLEDCDKILRIEAKSISPRFVELLVQSAGFYCSELE